MELIQEPTKLIKVCVELFRFQARLIDLQLEYLNERLIQEGEIDITLVHYINQYKAIVLAQAQFYKEKSIKINKQEKELYNLRLCKDVSEEDILYQMFQIETIKMSTTNCMITQLKREFKDDQEGLVKHSCSHAIRLELISQLMEEKQLILEEIAMYD